MKREGRQHGMVRSYRILPSHWNPNSQERFVNRFDSPPTAGVFTKVSSKPTNHSKFTGSCCRSKCLDCHLLPACKSKGKTKGTHKMRPRDMISNNRLVTWRLVEGKPGLNFYGVSATEILDHLNREDFYDDHYYDDEGGFEGYYGSLQDEENIEESGGGYGYGYECGYEYNETCPNDESMAEAEAEEEEKEIEAEEKEIEAEDSGIGAECDESGEDDDDDSFCEVGFVWEQVDGDGDEDWCLVREM